MINKTTKTRAVAVCVSAMICLAALPASAQQISSSEFVTTVHITVSPFATLEFNDPNPLLYLEVPPPGSTIPSTGVEFTVIGNASAALSAEPNAFMQVTSLTYKGVSNPFMGVAIHVGDEIGYDLQLQFYSPVNSFSGLPLVQVGPAVSPLMNIAGNGGSVSGVLHLIAHPNWTAGGGLALPGLYEGEIILTLTAS